MAEANGRVESVVNEVLLRGKVSSAPVVRTMPSGAEIATVRVSLARARTAMTAGSKATSDWMDCVAWSARTRRSVMSWRVGDVVELDGALRRRFFRGGGGPVSRVEVEILGARMVKRAE